VAQDLHAHGQKESEMDRTYSYVVVGAGLTGAAAARAIREEDPKGTVLLVGEEPHLPYNRPPLSKDLWLGKKTPDQIFVESSDFYATKRIDRLVSTRIVGHEAGTKTLVDQSGGRYRYERLLLATGCTPRKLDITGADLDGVYYYRTFDDYSAVRARATKGSSAVVIGGGFIGSEMAASLTANGVSVTMIFPDSRLVAHVFPEGLGGALTSLYMERGVRVLHGDAPTAVERQGESLFVTTRGGQRLKTDLVIVGIGVEPNIELARAAELELDRGIVVNAELETSRPGIYAAGDNAVFPYAALGRSMRIEHWDNALNQGQQAGRNMAGQKEAYTYMPYFFSDLFEFGYEAVGEVDARLETFADWKKEYDTGVVYYLRDGRVRGAMMCNVWGKLDEARALIREAKSVTPSSLKGAIAP
jgi:NADPH-dependent 2,4-dienoyl-CoA reductase/sulfur reductase-like enzyme